jgi:peptidoglycan/LPS O-acetylase OafA/YrhL
MPDKTTDLTATHFKYLDSARGIAALMVFVSHYTGYVYKFHNPKNIGVYCLLFNGNDAVSFFFVLSGFVLSYKYINCGKPLDIRKFYVTRFFRLFPPYFIIVTACSLWTFHDSLTIQRLKDLYVFNKFDFWQEAILFRYNNNFWGPGWTLTIEMICSFLIPFFVALALKNKRFINYFLLTIIVFGSSISFCFHFLLGILACCHYRLITSDEFKKTNWHKYRYLILAVAIVLFSLRQINRISELGSTLVYLMNFSGIEYFILSAIGSFVFLVAILRSKAVQRVLENRILVFVGRISFAIYLVHLLVLSMTLKYMGGPLQRPFSIKYLMLFTLVCFTTVFTTSALFYYFIEKPFIGIGRRITSKMKPSLIIQRDV